MSTAVADLGHFEVLADTFRHETGDPALWLFAQVLADSVRSQDLVCRHDGSGIAVLPTAGGGDRDSREHLRDGDVGRLVNGCSPTAA